MTNLEIIKKLRESTFTNEDGEQFQLEFYEGLSDADIEKMKKEFPNNTLDNELIEILKETVGWNGLSIEMVSFISIGQFGFLELSPYSLTLGHDGFGNFWILDIDSNGRLGKVYFACHDPAVFIISSQNLNEHLHHLLEFHENPSKNHLNKIHGKSVMNIWDNNQFCSTKTEFLSQNPMYKDFLNKFEGDEWMVADLRDAKNEAGFAWGKFGANKYTERHPTELIWVMKTKKKGFFAKLFG